MKLILSKKPFFKCLRSTYLCWKWMNFYKIIKITRMRRIWFTYNKVFKKRNMIRMSDTSNVGYIKLGYDHDWTIGWLKHFGLEWVNYELLFWVFAVNEPIFERNKLHLVEMSCTSECCNFKSGYWGNVWLNRTRLGYNTMC